MNRKRTPGVYQTARANLLLMMVLTAVNVAMALLGEDTYFLFTNFAAYILAAYAGAFYAFTGDGGYLVVGIVLALLVLAVYLLCWLLSRKRRGWMVTVLVLFGLDTVLLLLSALSDLMVSSILDILLHGLMLYYLIAAVRRGQPGPVAGHQTPPQPLPEQTEFYDASLGVLPDSRPLGEPVEKYRVLVSASWGSHIIEARRSRGLTELVIDGKVYGRQEGILEVEYRIAARLGGHVIATEYHTNGRQLLLVDEENIAGKRRLY